jgi:hypothetical protein
LHRIIRSKELSVSLFTNGSITLAGYLKAPKWVILRVWINPKPTFHPPTPEKQLCNTFNSHPSTKAQDRIAKLVVVISVILLLKLGPGLVTLGGWRT